MILELAERLRSAVTVEIGGRRYQYAAIIGELVHDGTAIARLADAHRDVDVFLRQVNKTIFEPQFDVESRIEVQSAARPAVMR